MLSVHDVIGASIQKGGKDPKKHFIVSFIIFKNLVNLRFRFRSNTENPKLTSCKLDWKLHHSLWDPD